MEDSMDMEMSPLRSQNYLFSCELKADKDYHFKVDNDENEYQLSLRTVSLGAGAKDELPIVEAEAMNYEGSPIKVTLATLKMCGSGPVHISGQHLVAVEEDAESEDEEEEDVKLLSISGKRSAPGCGSKVPQKKVKLAADEEDDDDDDEDDDDEDDDDDGFDDEEAEEKAPVKKSIQDTPAKNAQKSNQNGKDSKPSSTLRSKGQESFKKQEKTPKTPKGPSSVEDIKAKMQASIKKVVLFPKWKSSSSIM
uniref:Nucleophosmin n=1 Tax=Macaca mulatta TaxID=9544 RepID=A0A5F8A4L4_MACMU